MYVQVCQFSVFLGRHIIAHTRNVLLYIDNKFIWIFFKPQLRFCFVICSWGENANMHVLTNVLFAWLFIK